MHVGVKDVMSVTSNEAMQGPTFPVTVSSLVKNMLSLLDLQREPRIYDKVYDKDVKRCWVKTNKLHGKSISDSLSTYLTT